LDITMSDRVQLNLRLDKYPEMHQLIQTRAKKEGSSLNDFAVNLLREGLGLDVEKTPAAEALNRISLLEQRFEKLESSLLGGIENLKATPPPKQSEEEVEQLKAELARVTVERDDYAATVDDFLKDHKLWQERVLTPEKCDRVLAALGVGKQSAQYEQVKAVLDQMMPRVSNR